MPAATPPFGGSRDQPKINWGIPQFDDAHAQVVIFVHSQTYRHPSDNPDGPAAGSDGNYATPETAQDSHVSG